MAEYRNDRREGGRSSGSSFGSGRSSGSSRFGSRDSGSSRFGGRSSSGPSRFGGGRDRDSGRPEMHQVTCDKCGKECEVPFKPTSDKPVYCSTCFRKDGGDSRAPRRDRDSDSGSSSSNSSQALDEINAKLDKIMKSLNID